MLLFKKYRSAVPIQYTQLGGVVTNTTAYGPYHQIWTAAPNKFSENGYGLSISAAKDFGARFTAGQVYPCYYSLKNPLIVSMDSSGFYSFFLLLPLPFLIIGLLICIVPSIYYCFDKNIKRKRQEAEFMEWSKRRETQQKLEKMLRRDYLIKGGYDDDSLDFDDLRNLGQRTDVDEEDYQITKINVLGNFFPPDDVEEEEEDETEEQVSKINKLINDKEIDNKATGPKLINLDDD